MRQLGTFLFWLGFPFLVVFKSVYLLFLGGVWQALQLGRAASRFIYPWVGGVKRAQGLLRFAREPFAAFGQRKQQTPLKLLEKNTSSWSENYTLGYERAWGMGHSLRFAWWWWRAGRQASASRKVFSKRETAPESIPAAAPPARAPHTFRQAVGVTFVLAVIASIGFAGRWVATDLLADLPTPQYLRDHPPAASTKIYDRHGRLLYTIFRDENRTIVPLDSVSPYLVQATLAIEDDQFYEHAGVSFRGMTRALWNNLQGETLQGGSTITQQLVKNTLLTTERTWRRKIREIVLALWVETEYSKDDILSYYLNDVNYGGSVYGVEEASQWYFGKSARDVSLAEASLLAGLPQSPSVYAPFGSYPELSRQRQQEVLRRMREIGYITPEQEQYALAEQLAFKQGSYEIRAPHFVLFVREQLAQMFGEEQVSQGGLEVYTTLDLDIQATAEAAISKELDRLGRLKVKNGAAMITDPRSGEILAMVGSKNYFDQANDGQVNVALRERQPGSSIKPITYALAFERGFTPASIIEDSPVVYTSPGAPPYTPKNYDGRFHGKVTLREALGSSYNIPAVRLLVELGIDSMMSKARAMGITTWKDPSRYGLALTLGSGEVTMYDMAQVYGVFANGGVKVPLSPLLQVKRYDGAVLYRNQCEGAENPCGTNQVLSAQAAYQITSVLSDNAARSPAFGPNSVLKIPNQEVAVKTGTTNSLRDNWTIGYTQDRVVLTWVGNNDNTSMSSVASGVTGASPIWNSIMREQLAERLHHFALPTGLQKVEICAQTGTLPCSGCPQVVEEVMSLERIPTRACDPAQFAQKSEPPEDARTANRAR